MAVSPPIPLRRLPVALASLAWTGCSPIDVQEVDTETNAGASAGSTPAAAGSAATNQNETAQGGAGAAGEATGGSPSNSGEWGGRSRRSPPC